MCTVTYLPLADGILFTSNRDEKTTRGNAVLPAIYPSSTGNLLYPKDLLGGGTWIAAHDNGNVIVFLNGGFEAHEPNPPYKKSRGLILLELIDAFNMLQQAEKIDLSAIEPFTAILWQDGCLSELRWTGSSKEIIKKDPQVPHLWASATLYADKIIEKRRAWFQQWLEKNPAPAQQDILNFHRFAGEGDNQNDLVIERNGILRTVSITSILINDDKAFMSYLDLAENFLHKSILSFSPVTLPR